MANYQQISIIGHLGKDPESRFMPNGDQVANFSVAVTESWKDKNTGDKKEETTWFRVSAFKKLAEICAQYLKKGTPVQVVGKMKMRKWKDDKGNDRESWDLIADSMQMLGGRQEQQSGSEAAGTNKGSSFPDDSDIPF